MDVYLMRHAHAVESGEWFRADDTRPLTAKGREAAAVVAEGLAREEPPIGQIVTSPYTRAAETARIVGQRLGASVTVNAALAPGLDMAGFVGTVMTVRHASTLLLVGHEPDIGAICAGIARHPVALKKAAVALLQLPAIAPANAAPAWRALSDVLADATLIWLRSWREWEEPGRGE